MMEHQTNLIPAVPLVPENLVPLLSISLLVGGGAMVAIFSAEEAFRPQKKAADLTLGLISAVLLAFGFTLLLVWCGIFL
jgi:hypothetical protein